jgi:hypothetical protein
MDALCIVNYYCSEIGREIDVELSTLSQSETGTFHIKQTNGDVHVFHSHEDIYSHIVHSVLRFCGCGMPEDAMHFYMQQLMALEVTPIKDYNGRVGGLDFFIHIAELQQMFDKATQTLTPKARAILHALSILFPVHLKNEEHELCPLNEFVMDKEAYDAIIHTEIDPVWKKAQEDAGVSFEKEQLPIHWYVFNHVNVLGFHLLLDIYKHIDQIKNPECAKIQRSEWCSSNYGAQYWTWYMIDNILDLEQHGGSSPGWLSETGQKTIVHLHQLFVASPLPSYVEELLVHRCEFSVVSDYKADYVKAVLSILKQRFTKENNTVGLESIEGIQYEKRK